MHTVELLEEAIRAASALGYVVRQEWLGGAGGGGCEIRGCKHLFIDLSLSVPDQLLLVLDALRREKAASAVQLSQPLRTLLYGATRIDRAA